MDRRYYYLKGRLGLAVGQLSLFGGRTFFWALQNQQVYIIYLKVTSYVYETSLEHLDCSWLSLACHSIVILGWQYCPPAIWLRALSRMALINAITPIPYSSPMLLIKSPKIYNAGRLLHGCDHKFVRMRRTRAIPHVKVGRRVVSSPLRPDNTHQPRTYDVDPISAPTNNFQRPHLYR